MHQQRISLNKYQSHFSRCEIIRSELKRIQFEFYFYHTPEAALKFVVGRKEKKNKREIRADFK